jgi:Spy/CpxP family protein refolding chaperone
MTLRIAILAAALALTAFITPVRAQDPGAQAEIAAFQKSLNITAAQKAKFEAINKKYQPRVEALMAKFKPQQEKLMKSKPTQQQMMALRSQMMKQMQPLMDGQRKESEAILTPDQRAKVKAFEAKMRAMQAKMGGAPKG